MTGANFIGNTRAVEPEEKRNIMSIPSKEELREAARILKTKNSKIRERREAGKILAASGGGHKGGVNRARNLTPEERTAIARLGGQARGEQRRAERDLRNAQAKLNSFKKNKG